jgi:hypothetical protein
MGLGYFVKKKWKICTMLRLLHKVLWCFESLQLNWSSSIKAASRLAPMRKVEDIEVYLYSIPFMGYFFYLMDDPMTRGLSHGKLFYIGRHLYSSHLVHVYFMPVWPLLLHLEPDLGFVTGPVENLARSCPGS